MRSLRRRAKQLLGLGSVSEAFTGAVVAIQRTDSALPLNVHLHVLALDGVYVREPQGALRFHGLPTPSSEQVADIARRSAQRLARAFVAQGRPSPWQPAAHAEPDPEPVSLEQPGLFPCYVRQARRRTGSGGQQRRAAARGGHRRGVGGAPDVGVLASRDPQRLSLLVWHHHDDDTPGPAAAVRLVVDGLPVTASRTRLSHHRVDATHGNVFGEWPRLGSPPSPSVEQEAASALPSLEDTPASLPVDPGRVRLEFALPRHAVSLLELDVSR